MKPTDSLGVDPSMMNFNPSFFSSDLRWNKDEMAWIAAKEHVRGMSGILDNPVLLGLIGNKGMATYVIASKRRILGYSECDNEFCIPSTAGNMVEAGSAFAKISDGSLPLWYYGDDINHVSIAL